MIALSKLISGIGASLAVLEAKYAELEHEVQRLEKQHREDRKIIDRYRNTVDSLREQLHRGDSEP